MNLVRFVVSKREVTPKLDLIDNTLKFLRDYQSLKKTPVSITEDLHSTKDTVDKKIIVSQSAFNSNMKASFCFIRLLIQNTYKFYRNIDAFLNPVCPSTQPIWASFWLKTSKSCCKQALLISNHLMVAGLYSATISLSSTPVTIKIN